MTTSLKLTYVKPPPPEEPSGPVLVTVIDHELMVVREVILAASDPPVTVEVNPGPYCIRVRQSSGAKFDLRTMVEDGKDMSVSVQPRSPTPTVPAPDNNDTRFSSARGLEAVNVDTGRSFWLRVLAQDHPTEPSSWRPIDGAVHEPERLFDQGLLKLSSGRVASLQYNFKVKVPLDRLAVLQLGGEGVPWRCVALPPSPRPVSVTIARVADSTRSPVYEPSVAPDGGVCVSILLGNGVVDSLLSTLSPYRPDAPEPLVESLADSGPIAESMLRAKFEDTAAGVIGGYFLIDRKHFKSLHNWPSNLAASFLWLPDGPIILGWQLVQSASMDSLIAARESFLEAVRRGFPVFTHGMRLLRDGLGYFAMMQDWNGHPPYTGDVDEAVRTACQRFAPYVAAADLDVPSTTFYGEDPDEPSLVPKLGRPTDAGNLPEFLI
jgi:hypothetical protein